MSSALLHRYGKNLVGKNLSSYEPVDAYYELVTDANGRTKSRKRSVPIGLTKHDENVLKSVRRRAHYLDKGFNLCGFRFGWTAVLALIPLAGDIAAAWLNYKLVLCKCLEIEGGLPSTLVSRMVFNNIVSAGIGFVPLIGDIALAIWKANTRNAHLLEEYLIEKAQIALDKTSISSGTAAMSSTGSSSMDTSQTNLISRSASPSIDVSSNAVEETIPKKKKIYGWGRG